MRVNHRRYLSKDAEYSAEIGKRLQPGGRKFLWTLQLDIDIPLGKEAAASGS